MTEAAGAGPPGIGARAPGLTVREDSVDLLSSDLALRCGDRGEAKVSGRGAVGASLGRSCGREQPPVSTSQESQAGSREMAAGAAGGSRLFPGEDESALSGLPWQVWAREGTEASVPGLLIQRLPLSRSGSKTHLLLKQPFLSDALDTVTLLSHPCPLASRGPRSKSPRLSASSRAPPEPRQAGVEDEDWTQQGHKRQVGCLGGGGGFQKSDLPHGLSREARATAATRRKEEGRCSASWLGCLREREQLQL